MSLRDRIAHLLPKRTAWLAVAVLTAAALATVLIFLAIWSLAPPGTYLVTLLFERSWIQPVTTFCFWVTMVILGTKYLGNLDEREALARAGQLIAEAASAAPMIWSEEQTVRERFEAPTEQRHRDSLTFRRIRNALDRLSKTQSTRALEDYFRVRSEGDAGELDTGYTGVRYLLWLIPTLGFIGTVLGIGVGLAGFSKVLEGAESLQQIRGALPGVTSSLGTAFDTTLLALVLSAIAVFTMSYVLNAQEQVLEELDDLCLDRVCPLFQEHSTVSAEIVKAIHDKVDLVVQRNDGNRAQIEAVILQRLPAILAEYGDAMSRRLEDPLSHLREGLQAIADKAEKIAQHTAPPEKGASGLEQLLLELREIRRAHEATNTEPPRHPPAAVDDAELGKA
jgi:biopolymer transport protein ExbB/TolQ